MCLLFLLPLPYGKLPSPDTHGGTIWTGAIAVQPGS